MSHDQGQVRVIHACSPCITTRMLMAPQHTGIVAVLAGRSVMDDAYRPAIRRAC